MRSSKPNQAVEVEIDLGGSTCSKTVPAGSKLVIQSPDGATLLEIKTLCYLEGVRVHHTLRVYEQPKPLAQIIAERAAALQPGESAEIGATISFHSPERSGKPWGAAEFERAFGQA